MTTENNPQAETQGYWQCLSYAYDNNVITKNELRQKLGLPTEEGFDLTKKQSRDNQGSITTSHEATYH